METTEGKFYQAEPKYTRGLPDRFKLKTCGFFDLRCSKD